MRAWLLCALALGGCGSSFAAAPAGDAASLTSDASGELEAAAGDVVQVDAGVELEAAAVDAGDPLCCWIAWTANGGCCPAPDDPSCAYACDKAPAACVAGDTTCTSGGCFGTVRACP